MAAPFVDTLRALDGPLAAAAGSWRGTSGAMAETG
jgi:hypothetical protein